MNTISTDPANRVIPLTPAGPHWSQREYVAALGIGIQFAAHRHGALRQAFHYAFPEGIPCTSVIVDVSGPLMWVDHGFSASPEWLNRCRAAVAVIG